MLSKLTPRRALIAFMLALVIAIPWWSLHTLSGKITSDGTEGAATSLHSWVTAVQSGDRGSELLLASQLRSGMIDGREVVMISATGGQCLAIAAPVAGVAASTAVSQVSPRYCSTGSAVTVR